MSNLSTLKSDVRRHDAFEVATGCAALELVPGNTPHLAQIGALSRYVLAQSDFRDRTPAHDRWRRWLTEAPSLHAGPKWDEPEGLFCEPIHFFGGSFTIPVAGEPGLVFSLQLVLDALTFEEWPDHAEEYRREVFNATGGVLRWLNEAARAAHPFRYEHVGAAPRVEVPATARFRSVVSALTLSTERFAELLDGRIASAASLVRDLGDGPIPFSDDPSEQPFELRPILKRADRYLLAEPAAAVVALRHFAIVAAAKAGLRDELAVRIANRTHGWLIEAARRMGWVPHRKLPQPDGDPVVSLIFGIDADKAAHVALVNDDLDGYDHEDPRGWWDPNADVTQGRRGFARAPNRSRTPVLATSRSRTAWRTGCGSSTVTSLRSHVRPGP